MTRDEMVRETAKRTGYTIAVCNEIVREAFQVMTDELFGHGYVKVPNFGTFYVSPVAAGRRKLPDGTWIDTEASHRPRMKYSGVIKEGVR